MQEKKLISMNLMDYPEYKKEWLLLQDLKGKIQDEQRELEAPSRDAIQEIEDRKQQNIDRVLLGGKPEDISYVDIYRNNLYNKTQKRIRVYREAVTQQEKIVTAVHLKISKEIAKQTKPEYEVIIKAVCVKLCELGELSLKEINLREGLNDNQIAFTSVFTAMPVRIGDPRILIPEFQVF